MAKTIQEQYNQIKKGKGSKELFLKEVKRNYPNMIVNSANYKQAEEILLNRSVITENLAGVVNPTKSPDWFSIFNKNMNIIKEESAAAKKDEAIKAEVKEPNKDVVELETKGFDYKDDKNIDNLNGQEFQLGVKFEMDKVRDTVSDADLGEAIEKAQTLVAKNLASDPLYYIKNAMFGVDKLGYTDEAPGLTVSKSDKMEKLKLKENKMISLIDLMESGPLGEKPVAKKKVKKETLDSKLAEIDKQSQVVALEAKMAHIDEIIEKKNARLSMVTEDENLSELVDKAKIKVMQREVKDLEKRQVKMERLYEKMCGKAYKKPITDVDEDMGSSNYAGASNSDTSERAFRNNKDEEIAEESNANSNDGSDGNSNYNSNENPESYSGLKKFRQNN
jgi:hypothetical protein|tara:strand:- start:319 stop:1491 length:1173 start_codon:yes stop_codon:yes gene_type:complete